MRPDKYLNIDGCEVCPLMEIRRRSPHYQGGIQWNWHCTHPSIVDHQSRLPERVKQGKDTPDSCPLRKLSLTIVLEGYPI